MADITVTVDGLEEIRARFNALPRQADVAGRRASSKVAAWVRTQTLREMAGKVGLAQKIIRRRVFVKKANRNLPSAIVWWGLNPMAVTEKVFGRLAQQRAGAKAGGRLFGGAFVATMSTGHKGVFRRIGSKRLPITHERVNLEAAGARAVIAAWKDRAAERMRETLAQELNYEVNVKGARS